MMRRAATTAKALRRLLRRPARVPAQCGECNACARIDHGLYCSKSPVWEQEPPDEGEDHCEDTSALDMFAMAEAGRAYQAALRRLRFPQ